MRGSVEFWETWQGSAGIEVSSFGRVRTLDCVRCSENRTSYKRGHYYKNCPASNDYLRVCIPINGKRVFKYVHRLVAETFIQNPNDLPQVNHKNCIRDDNRVDNLEWCDASYNIRYKEKFGKALSRPMFAVNLSTLKVSWFPSQREAGRVIGVDAKYINIILDNPDFVNTYFKLIQTSMPFSKAITSKQKATGLQRTRMKLQKRSWTRLRPVCCTGVI